MACRKQDSSEDEDVFEFLNVLTAAFSTAVSKWVSTITNAWRANRGDLVRDAGDTCTWIRRNLSPLGT